MSVTTASLFDGIGAAIETIERHIRAGSRIVVHGDYDVDGVCATAVLVRALRSLGADVGWYLPSRSEDGYGLSAATVARLCESATGLLVTVDCGITAIDEVAQARAGGLDVVVTDHHSVRGDGELPDCPIVHPVVGGYPSREMCGTAVAHKLAEALGAPDRGAGPRARRAGDGGRPDAAAGREPQDRARGTHADGGHAAPRSAGADAGVPHGSECARRLLPGIQAGAANQRRRTHAARRRGPGAPADRGSATRRGDRPRARCGQQRPAHRRAAHQLGGRGARERDG